MFTIVGVVPALECMLWRAGWHYFVFDNFTLCPSLKQQISANSPLSSASSAIPSAMDWAWPFWDPYRTRNRGFNSQGILLDKWKQQKSVKLYVIASKSINCCGNIVLLMTIGTLCRNWEASSVLTLIRPFQLDNRLKTEPSKTEFHNRSSRTEYISCILPTRSESWRARSRSQWNSFRNIV